MTNDNEIITMFFNRSQEAIKELADKYGKICTSLSYRILAARTAEKLLSRLP